ncbi:response regulator [bacterium]|nr:response regulator [bacterium]MBU1651763.1 response regulator [bacterium]
MENFRLLLIDDEEELVSTLVERLDMRGIEAEYAMSGIAALKLLEQKKFDVVLLDYKLPGMSGLLVMEEINKRYPQIKVLLITGAGGPEEEITRFIELRSGEVLLKPIDIEVLIETVKKSLKEK